MSVDWTRRWLGMARYVAGWSKDPSTKVGAVIVDSDQRFVSMGFNGFPQGVKDTEERLNNREIKYQMIVHAERNAMDFAERSLTGCTMYTWPLPSCATCAGDIIQRKLIWSIAPEMSPELAGRWGENVGIGQMMFREAGIASLLVPIGWDGEDGRQEGFSQGSFGPLR